MENNKINRLVLIVLLLAYVLYAAYYIYQTSFVLEGTRYFVLNDDAMISMRYAHNFARGYGLVWNPGDAPVEGYTNPLWVIYMAVFHLFPIPPSKISLAIQISGALFMALNMVVVKKITEQFTANPFVIFAAVIITGFYGPLNNWSLLGMEVSVLVWLVGLAVLKTIHMLKSERFSPWPYIILGIGTLIRVDMAVPYLTIFAFLLIADPANRKRHLAWGGGLFLAFILSQTAFRLWYYGDPLPNTYYLKVTGVPFLVRIGKGLYAFVKFAWNMNWIIFLLPFTILFFRRDKYVLLVLLVFLAQVAYSIYVGGDAWEHKGGSNRYISLAIPQFFILLCLAAEKVFEAISAPIRNLHRRVPLYVNLGLSAFLLVAMVNINAVLDLNSLKKWIGTAPIEFTVGNELYTSIALAMNKVTTQDASIAVQAAGSIPYFTDLRTFDMWGKSDPVIARQDVHLPPGLFAGIANFRPGHIKWDYYYSIVEHEPDIIVQMPLDEDITGADTLAFVEQHYTIIEIDGITMQAKNNSSHVLWDQADEIYK
jgi:arabinofuranosyltransferase